MHVGILGPLEASEDGRPLEIGPRRQRAVFLLLFLHAGEVISSERLIDELWGERPPPTATKILQGQVSHLRRVLPKGAIETRGSGYVLRSAGSDRDTFEALLAAARIQEPREAAQTLRAALDLWRGRPLADVEYEAWAQSEIARLEELRQVALEERIAAALQLGEHSQAVPELEALIAAHPLRERLRALLMLALYRSGRQADALEAYASARKRLAEELGLEPGPELRELQRRILEQDPELVLKTSAVRTMRRRAPWLVVVGGLLIAASAIAAGVLLTRGGAGGVPVAVPNSLGVVNPASNRLVNVIPVGNTPTSVAVGGGAVWVLNSNEETVSRVDPARHTVVKTFGSGTQPVALAVGAGAVWVAEADLTLRRIDPTTYLTATAPIPHAGGANAGAGQSSWVAGNGAAVWANNGVSVSRVEPAPHLVVLASNIECCGPLVVGAGSIWTTDNQALLRLDARTGARLARRDLPFLANSFDSTALAVGAGSVWVADGNGSSVWRIDIRTNRVIGTIAVGNHPSGVAVGYGAVWVASSDGTVSRIDPNGAQGLGKVAQTIAVGGTPNGIAAGDGAVWVSLD